MLSLEIQTMSMQSLPQCLPSGLPFQNHLLSITLLTWKSVSGDLKSNCAASLSSITTKLSAMSIPSSNYNFTNWKNSLSWETLIWTMYSLSLSIITKLLSISGSSPKYHSTRLKVLCLRWHEQWLCSLFPCINQVACHFKATSQI